MRDFSQKGMIESDTQHVEDTLKSRNGWFKFDPQFGIGIDDMISGNLEKKILQNRLSTQLKAQGITNYEVNFS